MEELLVRNKPPPHLRNSPSTAVAQAPPRSPPVSPWSAAMSFPANAGVRRREDEDTRARAWFWATSPMHWPAWAPSPFSFSLIFFPSTWKTYLGRPHTVTPHGPENSRPF
jgi:hypothetical protein